MRLITSFAIIPYVLFGQGQRSFFFEGEAVFMEAEVVFMEAEAVDGLAASTSLLAIL